MTGTGKTTEVKKLLFEFKNLRPFIYDVNNEYGQPRMEINDFLERATQKRNSLIVFEEATIFFGTKGRSEKLLEILVGKRHTKNLIVLCFHGLRFVPNDILALTDYIFIKKTNDNPNYLSGKFAEYPKIIQAYEKAQSSPDRFYTEKIKNIV